MMNQKLESTRLVDTKHSATLLTPDAFAILLYTAVVLTKPNLQLARQPDH